MMTLTSSTTRPRAIGGVARPENGRHNKSPAITCILPPDLFDRLAADAAARGVPIARVMREALRLKYPEPKDSP